MIRPTLVVIGVGLLTFLLVFASLDLSGATTAPDQAETAQAPAESALPIATDSVAAQVRPAGVAVGVPTGGSEPLLRNVRPGDHLDILATLPSTNNDRPITAVIVRGATVLRSAESGDPLLLEVAAPDAMELAHVVLSGTHLSYLVWSPAATPPPAAR